MIFQNDFLGVLPRCRLRATGDLRLRGVLVLFRACSNAEQVSVLRLREARLCALGSRELVRLFSRMPMAQESLMSVLSLGIDDD